MPREHNSAQAYTCPPSKNYRTTLKFVSQDLKAVKRQWNRAEGLTGCADELPAAGTQVKVLFEQGSVEETKALPK